MKLVAGLGNPGREYEGTPHNVGFQVLDFLIEHLGVSGFQSKFRSKICSAAISGESCLFIKPQTYMNKSGEAVAEVANFYKIPLEKIVIVSDDIDLPPGKVRFRDEGGHGGHNGLRSVIESLGNGNFHRIRFGVGRPADKDSVIGHVLGSWSEEEKKKTKSAFNLALKEIVNFLETSEFKNVSFTVK